MPCEFFQFDTPRGKTSGIICGPRRRMAPCTYCPKAHTHLCDYPTIPIRQGGAAGPCDRKLCADHRTPGEAGLDYCPEHAKLLPVPDLSPPSQMALWEST